MRDGLVFLLVCEKLIYWVFMENRLDLKGFDTYQYNFKVYFKSLCISSHCKYFVIY